MQSIFSQNILFTRIVSSLIVLIEIFISKSFLTYVFNLSLSKIRFILFFLICFSLEILSTWIAPVAIFPFINIFINFICISIFFKISFTQKMFILVIPLTFFQLAKMFFMFIVTLIINVTPMSLINIPVLRPIIIFPTYFIMFLFLDYLKRVDVSGTLSYDLDLSNKIVINSFSLFTLLSVLVSGYFFYTHFSEYTIVFILINILLIALLIVLIFKILDLKSAKTEIESEKNSYNCLCACYDGIRGFKHDFSNIMQSIGGYILNDDLDGLKKYYSSVFKDCSELKKLALFNKEVLNSPPVLSLIAEKYYKAKELGIDFNVEVFVDLNDLNMDIYEFTRILGIFLDNSIEAASQSSKKVINIMISKDFRNHFDLITIENSCDSNDVDTEKIFEKDFSTKPKNSGLGLWKVKSIVNKYDNVFLNTSLRDNFFRHQLKIYY